MVHAFVDIQVSEEVLMNQLVRRQMLGKAFFSELGKISFMMMGYTKECSPMVCHCQGIQRYKETSSGVFELKKSMEIIYFSIYFPIYFPNLKVEIKAWGSLATRKVI